MPLTNTRSCNFKNGSKIQVLLVSLIIQGQRAVTCCGSPKQPKWKSLKHELGVLTLTKLYNTHSFHSKMKLEPYMWCLLSGQILKKEQTHGYHKTEYCQLNSISQNMCIISVMVCKNKYLANYFFDVSLTTWKYAA